GFGGVPVYDVFIFVLLESRRDDIITRANSVAFSFFLALFPSLIFLIAILPYFPVGDLSEIFEFYLDTVLPASAESFLHTTLRSGFGGVPVYDVFIFVLLESRRDDIITRANSVAFSFFLALFPSLIFLIAILPYFPVGDLSEIFEFYLDTVLPASAESFLHTTL